MELITLNDLVGFIGVLILLVAFLLNLAGKLTQDSPLYIWLNVLGAGLACFAALLIRYMPFVILEGTWTVVSLVALIKVYAKKRPGR